MIELIAVAFLALVATALVVLFGSRFRNRLSVRIALLILGTAPLVLISLIVFNALYAGSIGRSTPVWLRISQMLAVVFGTPLLMGWLASRYVTQPLRNFTDAIQSLKRNKHHEELKSAGIVEFDQVFAEFNDLTKRLHHEEELRKNLISDTSHELNTPLMAILSQLSAVEDGLLPMDNARLRLLRAQTERLRDLVSQLATYTKARTPDAFSQTSPVRLHDLMTRLSAIFTPFLADHHMQLVIVVPEDGIVDAHPASLEQIITNLIQNAIRYSKGTTVTVRLAQKQLIVSDDGIGVPDESLPYLFERFYRVDPSRSRETGGLGLGLAIVAELVASQGWEIKAENDYPGLRMTISL